MVYMFSNDIILNKYALRLKSCLSGRDVMHAIYQIHLETNILILP